MTVRRAALAAALLAAPLLASAACEPLFEERGDPAGPASAASPVGPASPGSPSGMATSSSAPATPTAPDGGTPATSATAAPDPGTVPPAWLGTRVLPTTSSGYGEIRRTPRELRDRRFTLPDTVAALPGTGFAAEITSPPPPDVLSRSTWEPGCPVTAGDLAWIRLTFRGFDGARHTGELLVHEDVADDMETVFRRLWRADFPMEEMRVVRRDELDLPPTGDGNNTTGFVCRAAVGSSRFSEHAYGLAVDVNPFHNPYSKGSLVLPELASAYLDRSRRRPGMIHPGDAVIRAFASVGWGWGGEWNSLKDRHHFSLHDR